MPDGNFTVSDGGALARILVVDDEEPIRMLMTQGLQKENYYIDTAASSSEAYERLKVAAYDLIICDIHMPGVSGKDFFSFCRKNFPEIIFILMTGFPKFNDAINLVKEGAFYYLTKPVDFDILYTIIQRALEEKRENQLHPDKVSSMLESMTILQTLGSGNSGTVFLAEKDGERFAVKILKRDPSSESEQLKMQRFQREADILKSLEHPGVVKVFEYNCGSVSTPPYIVMEYIEGKPLSSLIRNGTLGIDQKISMFKQIAEICDFVHGKGVIHRDLKPENILVSEDNSVKLSDFGICKVMNSELTMTGHIIGSPAYMAPESFDSSRKIDQRSDIFSLGVICYELFTGIRPFQGSNVYQVMEAIRDRKPQKPSKLNPEIPKWIEDVLAKMLNKNADGRFANSTELLKAVNYYIGTPSQHSPTSFTTRILRSMLLIDNIWG